MTPRMKVAQARSYGFHGHCTFEHQDDYEHLPWPSKVIYILPTITEKNVSKEHAQLNPSTDLHCKLQRHTQTMSSVKYVYFSGVWIRVHVKSTGNCNRGELFENNTRDCL